MIWLSGNVVVVSSAEELSRHYTNFTPRADKFSVETPYQADDQSGAHCESDESPLDRSKQPALATSLKEAPTGRTKRKRKQGGPQDAIAAERRSEANLRHIEHAHLLSKAYDLFKQWRRQHQQAEALSFCHSTEQQPNACRKQSAPQLVPETDMSAWSNLADESTTEAGQCASKLIKQAVHAQGFDLLSLAELKHVVKPRFQYVDGEDPDLSAWSTRLYDAVIGNDEEIERLAMAHETEVLVPRHARFMLSDITRLQPLMQGVLIFPSFWDNQFQNFGSAVGDMLS